MAQDQHDESRKQAQLVENFAVSRATDTITCPNRECGKQLAWDMSRAGREASCPFCGNQAMFPPRPKAVEKCQLVMEAYSTWLNAWQEYQELLGRENEYATWGGSRVDFEHQCGRLSGAEEEASTEFENALEALKRSL